MDLRLLEHLHQLVRDRDPYFASAGHFYVQQYVREQLSNWGDVTVHSFSSRGQTHHNFVLDLPGTITAPPILVGAHYDAVPGSPGADDNATGVAVLLELARAWSAMPGRYPLRLVAFDLEEFGLQGSRAYATELRQAKVPLRLMLSLEMLGYSTSLPNSQRYPAGLERFYPKQGNFLGLIGNWQALLEMRHLKRAVIDQGQIGCEWLPVVFKGQSIPDTRRSDHAPFWDAGYRAILVTDTANLRNPHYHQPSDRLETLDLDFLKQVAIGLIAGLRSL
jgi:aminopeptidase YwaD